MAFAVLVAPFTVPAASAADRDVVVTRGGEATRVVRSERTVRYRCPDGYGCYPLYGAYGPYGGAAYWSSFSYLVPTGTSEAVISSRY